MKNKKFLFVCESITDGGMTQILKVLAENFKHKADIIILVNKQAIDYYKDIKYVRLVSFPKTLADVLTRNKLIRFFLRIFFYFQSIIFFFVFLKKEQPDLIKVFAGGFPGGDVTWCMSIASKLIKTQNTYLSIHGEPNINWSLSNWVYNKVALNLLRNFKIVICVSKFQQTLITSETKFSKTTLVRNAMPIKIFDSYSYKLRDQYAKKSDLICIMVANYTWKKGYETALKAIMKVNSNNRYRLKLICFGDTKAGDFEAISNLCNTIDTKGLIRLFPFTSKIYKYYKIADFCIAPTLQHEAFGLSALESNLYERPVITSDLPAFEELVSLGLQGFSFKRGNVDECYLAILKLIDMKKSKQSFRYNEIKKNFNIDDMIIHYEKIFYEKS